MTFQDSARVNVRLIVGSDTVTDEMIQAVLAPLCERYGGATYYQASGCWAEDGDEKKEAYSNVATERAHVIEVSVLAVEYDMPFIQACFIPVANDATWINCEVNIVTAHHFNVKSIAESAMNSRVAELMGIEV